MSNGSAVRPLTDAQMHRRRDAHTDRRDQFYYLDRITDVGGKNIYLIQNKFKVDGWANIQENKNFPIQGLEGPEWEFLDICPSVDLK